MGYVFLCFSLTHMQEGAPHSLHIAKTIPSHPAQPSGPIINLVPTTEWYLICSRAAIKTNGTIADCRKRKQTEQITVCFRRVTTTEPARIFGQYARSGLLHRVAPMFFGHPRIFRIEKRNFSVHFRESKRANRPTR